MTDDGTARDATDFLLHWPTPFLVLCAIDPETPGKIETKSFRKDQPTEIAAWIKHWNGKRNLYFVVNECRTPMDKKPKKSDISKMWAVHVDIDPAKGVDPRDREAWAAEQDRILGMVQAAKPQGSVATFSGGGYQVFWLLAQPVEIDGPDDADRLEAYNRFWEKLWGGDHCFNIDRVMRIPFTMNLPNKKKLAAGRVVVMAGVVEAEWDLQYSIHDFQAWHKPAEPGSEKKGTPPPRKRLPEWTRRLIVHGNDPEGPHSYEGDRSRAVWMVCLTMLRCGVPQDEVVATILDADNKISEHVRAQPQPGPYAQRQVAKAHEVAHTEFQTVKRKKDGREVEAIVINQDNLRLALSKLEVKLSYDEFKNRDMIDGPEGIGLRPLDDWSYNYIYMLIDRSFGIRPQHDYMRMALNVFARESPFHPVKQYLDGLQWDGIERIDNWLVRYCGVEDSPYARAVGRMTLIGAVRRIRQPGCKHDEMMVLISPQGYDKSSAIRTLAVREEWFNDSFSFDLDTKGTMESLEGTWIVEVAELKGITTRNIEHIKSVLSRQVDKGRAAYARFAHEAPRTCIVIGTSNSDTFLRDPSGNRRVQPVVCQRIDVAALQHDRDLLWAEAAMCEAAGESNRLSPELYAAAALEQARRTVDDPWLALFEKALHGLDRARIPTYDMWAVVDIPVGLRTQDHQNRIGECVRALGWERKRYRYGGAGERQWFYKKGEYSIQYPLTTFTIVRSPDRGLEVIEVPTGPEQGLVD